MKPDLNRLMKIASQSDATVLITGPTGTGKTTLAKKIHDESKRQSRPFIAINLATLNEGVLESELFGHEKGAFTGADQKRIGKLEIAQGGTVFLDEISELSPRLQARLLEFLQSLVFCPVGSNREFRLDVRIIAATHKDLQRAVNRGEFREDLFHRLRVIAIPLEPLRERVDEFDMLVHESLKTAALQANRAIFRISKEVAEKFECYSWPGNLRELKNVLDYAVLAADGPEIRLGDLPFWLSGNETSLNALPIQSCLGVAEVSLNLDYQTAMVDFEREYLQRALTRYQGRINRTAREIGINKTTLIRRMRAYDIRV